METIMLVIVTGALCCWSFMFGAKVGQAASKGEEIKLPNPIEAAYKFLGSAQYAWVIAYFNNIEDGFSVYAGQKIRIPKTITQLFEKGECLASVSPLTLNLGTE